METAKMQLNQERQLSKIPVMYCDAHISSSPVSKDPSLGKCDLITNCLNQLTGKGFVFLQHKEECPPVYMKKFIYKTN
jgi:hypothetical protein